MLRVSCFESLRVSQGYLEDLTSLADLVAKPHFVCATKDAAGLFSPTEFRGNYRNNKNALQVHFGVVEFDHLTHEQVVSVLDHIEATKVAFAYYTTFNHDPDNNDCRFRIAVPFVKPVSAAHWTTHYWPRLAAFLAPTHVAVNADPQCKDPARFYYIPSCPPERAALAERIWNEGAALDLDALGPGPIAARAMTQTPGANGARPMLRKLTVDDLRDYQRKLRQRSGACAIGASECLRHVLRGEAWGDKDTRNERISNLCYELIKDFSTLDPQHVANLFSASCLEMQQQDAEAKKYTVKYVEDKLLEKVKYVETRQAQYSAENHADYLKKLQLAGFEGPYSPDEIAELQQLEVHPRGWILQQESGAFVFTRKYGYTYFRGQGAAKNAAAQNLLPALPYGVRTERIDKSGEFKVMPLDELVQLFGSVPDRVFGSLVEQKTRYASGTRTLTIAECPLRPLQPQHHEAIAEWFKLLGGNKHKQLLDWIAWLTYLDRPCAMLVIAGDTGVGKSLLANGLAKLWHGKDATPLEDALDSFNSLLAKCPLLLADESVPKDRDGKHRFDELRKLVTKNSFVLNEKHVTKREVEGSVRIIVAVNSLSLLVGDTPESQQELKATLERIVHITPDPEAITFMANLRECGAQWGPDAIAEHALYLRAERPLPVNPPRFLFEPDNQIQLASAFVASSALYGAIAYWLIAFLREPLKLYEGITSPHDPVWCVKVTENGFFATPNAVQIRWHVYGDKRPWAKSIQSAWVGFAKARTTVETPTRWRHTDKIDLDRLIAYTEEHAVADREEIVALMASYISTDVYGKAMRALAAQQEMAAGLRAVGRPAAAH